MGKKGGTTYQERPQSTEELELLKTQNELLGQQVNIGQQQEDRSQEMYKDWRDTYRQMELTDLKGAVNTANTDMGQVDQGEYGRQKANLFSGFDTGYGQASDQMNAGLARRGLSNSGIAVKANRDMAQNKASQYAGLNSQAYNMGVDKGDAYRQQKMSNLTGFAQLGRGMSGQSQNYLSQAGGTYGSGASQAGSTALGLGGLDNSYNQARWNADAQSASGKGSAVGTVAGAGITAMSDERLKRNISKVGEVNGHNLYTWDWNKEGLDIAGDTKTFGVLAQEAMKIDPSIVSVHDSGYLQVDYSKIFVGVA